MGLLVFGVNHRTASLEVRERVAYTKDEVLAELHRLRDVESVPQAMLLSTCNRTELYALAPDAENLPDRLRERVFNRRLNGSGPPPGEWVYVKQGPEAVEHLFRVACGLDSMVLGEPQILGQVRDAFSLAIEAQTTGSILHKLAARAFRVGKRARSETRIGEGSVSVAYVSVELAEKVFRSLQGHGLLVVGAGSNAELCVEHFLGRGAGPLIVANRTREKAEILASAHHGETLLLDRLEDGLVRSDVVVATTGAPDPLIRADMVRAAMSRRGARPLVFIDLAVPRDVAPDVDDVPNVFRFDMDSLKDVVERTLDRRRKEIPGVERLVEAETSRFLKWMEGLAASPVIRDLHASFEAVRHEELERHAKRFVAEDREQLEVFTKNLLRKCLMGVTTEIKRYRPDHPQEAERLAALRAMFHLEESEPGGEDDDDFA